MGSTLARDLSKIIIMRETCPHQVGGIFGESPKGGGRVISNPKKCAAYVVYYKPKFWSWIIPKHLQNVFCPHTKIFSLFFPQFRLEAISWQRGRTLAWPLKKSHIYISCFSSWKPSTNWLHCITTERFLHRYFWCFFIKFQIMKIIAQLILLCFTLPIFFFLSKAKLIDIITSISSLFSWMDCWQKYKLKDTPK